MPYSAEAVKAFYKTRPVFTTPDLRAMPRDGTGQELEIPSEGDLRKLRRHISTKLGPGDVELLAVVKSAKRKLQVPYVVARVGDITVAHEAFVGGNCYLTYGIYGEKTQQRWAGFIGPNVHNKAELGGLIDFVDRSRPLPRVGVLGLDDAIRNKLLCDTEELLIVPQAKWTAHSASEIAQLNEAYAQLLFNGRKVLLNPEAVMGGINDTSYLDFAGLSNESAYARV